MKYLKDHRELFLAILVVVLLKVPGWWGAATSVVGGVILGHLAVYAQWYREDS